MVLADYGADDPPISSPSIFYVLIVGSFISNLMSVSMCTSISKTNSFPPFQVCLCVEKLKKKRKLLEDMPTTSPKVYTQ